MCVLHEGRLPLITNEFFHACIDHFQFLNRCDTRADSADFISASYSKAA